MLVYYLLALKSKDRKIDRPVDRQEEGNWRLSKLRKV